MRVASRLLIALLALSLSAQGADFFKVERVLGSVKYRSAQQLRVETLSKGSKVESGGKVRLAKGNILVLSSPMGDRLTFKDSGFFTVGKLADGERSELVLELRRGEVGCRVAPLSKESSFEIITPVAVVGVRGTEFDCSVGDDGLTEVSVHEGVVEVSDAARKVQPVRVKKGSSARVRADQIIETAEGGPGKSKYERISFLAERELEGADQEGLGAVNDVDAFGEFREKLEDELQMYRDGSRSTFVDLKFGIDDIEQ
ncbi:MAG: FecR domain-containing protein [Planctomycetes bacterium]|nr:FecR domain-containing protein [Planctomycetota bacterium]